MSKPLQPRCCGKLTQGYWKGKPCAAIPKHVLPDGTTWCRAHVPFNRGRIKLLP